jgi:hypothetical protein
MNLPQFSVNPGRVDPYKKFKFLVKWDGKVIAGLYKMSVRTCVNWESF